MQTRTTTKTPLHTHLGGQASAWEGSPGRSLCLTAVCTRAILGTTKLIFVLALGIVVASYGSGGGEDTRELMLLELSPGG